MNEYLPYEQSIQQKLIDLPLPDENMAWQKMKKLLEDDDDDRVVVIPPRFRGCTGWIVLVGLLLIGLTWYFVSDQNWFTSKKQSESESGDRINKNSSTDRTSNGSAKEKAIPYQNIDNGNKESSKETGDPVTDGTGENANIPLTGQGEQNKKESEGKINTDERSVQLNSNGTYSSMTGNKKSTNSKTTVTGRNNNSTKGKKNPQRNNLVTTAPVLNSDNSITNTPGTSQLDPDQIEPVIYDDPVMPVDSVVQSRKNDTIQEVDTNLNTSVDTTGRANPKPETPVKKPRFTFGAGLGLQQQLPLSGQKPVPYNAYGREGSLADYIPSVYFRMYREKKWFIQSEFRYGAPQYAKEFTYGSKSVIDTLGGVNTVTTTSMSLKKSYYHQLPVSFNYFITPSWSAGGGFMWSKFFSAISEEQINRNRAGIDTVLSKKIVQVDPANDTSFTKSQFNLLLETQYSWKRFTFGVRYVRGLQPYIRFTDPSGVMREEKNQSFQLILKYELWKSK